MRAKAKAKPADTFKRVKPRAVLVQEVAAAERPAEVRASREGKKPLHAFIPKLMHKQLAVLAAQLETSQTDLIVEALMDLFEKNGHGAAQYDVSTPGSVKLAGTAHEYLTRIPSAGDIPADMVLVHNRVVPAHPLGMHGFRAWLQAPDDKLEVCACAWAPKAGPHYRVRRELLGRKKG